MSVYKLLNLPCSTPGRSICIWLAIGVVVVSASGCTTYSSSFAAIERNLAAQQYDAALLDIEQQSSSKSDRVLYLLNKGMVLRMKRDFVASNQSLEAAKAEMDRLYAASVSENTLSFIVNDATVSYVGDDYEQVLLHLYLALNYLELGQVDEARVEALQLDAKFRELGEKTDDSKFTENAFSRYLTGMIYEASGEWSDAMIAYRKAYEAYKKYPSDFELAMPTLLKHDLLRVTQQMGLSDELAKYKDEFGLDQRNKVDSPQWGEMIFVLSNGLAPIKRETAVPLIDPTTGILARIALPHYESRLNDVVSARITVSGKQVVTELMEDVDAVARQKLNSRMGAITARSLARAVAKITASKAAQQSALRQNSDDAATMGMLGAFAVQVTALATERADTRSWLTLPADLQLARMSLPAGTYGIRVELWGEGGQVIASTEYPEVVISKSRKTFLTQHWIPAQ